jgi:hypothetical protein
MMGNDREVGSQSQVVGGFGDIGGAVRYEAASIGEYQGLPSLAVTIGGLAPTGRRPEQALPPLFAGTTGRGSWGVSLGLESEYAFLPWFVQFNAAASYFFPFQRPDIVAREQYGPLLQAGLSGGREIVPDAFVLALALFGEWESSTRMDGLVTPGSQAFSLSAAGSASWRLDGHWTLTGVLNNTMWPSGLGTNRDARIGFTLGGRYGFF